MKRIGLLLLLMTVVSYGQPPIWIAFGGSGGITASQVVDSIDANTYPTGIDSAYSLLMLNGTSDSIVYSGFRTNATRDTIWARNGSIVFPSGDGWLYKRTTVDTNRAQTIGATMVLYELTHTLDAASLYEFEASGLIVTSNGSNTTGPHALVTCVNAPTRISGIAAFPGNGSVGAGLMFHDVQANATASTANTDTVKIASSFAGTAPMPYSYTGEVLTNSATELKLFLYASPTGSNTITIYKGFYFRVRKKY